MGELTRGLVVELNNTSNLGDVWESSVPGVLFCTLAHWTLRLGQAVGSGLLHPGLVKIGFLGLQHTGLVKARVLLRTHQDSPCLRAGGCGPRYLGLVSTDHLRGWYGASAQLLYQVHRGPACLEAKGLGSRKLKTHCAQSCYEEQMETCPHGKLHFYSQIYPQSPNHRLFILFYHIDIRQIHTFCYVGQIYPLSWEIMSIAK